MAFNWRKFPWTNLHDLNLDWIIQTVKTLEENLAAAVSTFQEMINRAILNTLTGEGEFNVIKTGNVLINGKNVEMRAGEVAEGGNSIKLSENGDVRISGNSVQLTGGTVVSDGAEQLTLHNPNSNTSVTASYNNGVLSLWNNQDLSEGVAVYPINTPADGGGDNSSFAANVGYVKDAVAAVDGKLDTEISNRASGDAALQADIDGVKTQLQIESNERQANDTAIRENAIFNVAADISDDFTGGNITLDSTVISQLKAALSINRLVSLTLKNFTVASNLYQTRYLLLDNYASPPSANGEYTANFYNVGKTLSATIDTATGVLTYTEF